MTAQSSDTPIAQRPSPLMDLRTNRLDLGLAPDMPGAGDRALALGEKLLAYCADAARPEYGERLMAVALLSQDELGVRPPAGEDPDAPADVLQALNEDSPGSEESEPPPTPAIGQTGSLFEPAAAEAPAMPRGAAAPKRLTSRQLKRLAIRRFTQLMAATHGQALGSARSKRFAGVVDAYIGNARNAPHAVGLMLLGGEVPTEPALAERLADPDTETLDTPAAQQAWLEGLAHWGSHRRGSHIRAKILLQQLVDLALRVYIRGQGIEDGAPEDELGVLLGSTLMLRVSLGSDILKGYRIITAIDEAGVLSVRTPKGAQRVSAAEARQPPFAALGRAPADYPGLPLLECQTLSPDNRLDATRFGKDMVFFQAVDVGAESTHQRRLDNRTEKLGSRERAAEKERQHRKTVLESGLVLKNRAQDLVERCLEEALGTGVVKPWRFQPVEGRRVPVRSESKKDDTLPEFLRAGLPGLQVVYSGHIQEASNRDALHAALERALVRHGIFGHDAGHAAAKRISVREGLQQTQASSHPVLVVQAPQKVSTPRGASVVTSGWVALGDSAARPLTGNATAHALAARDYAGERGIGWQADLYTRAKLALYDAGRDDWRALQGLNLSSADMDNLIADKEPGELKHKLDNISRELTYKYRLQQGEAFSLSGALKAGKTPAHFGTERCFICLYGYSPKGAPARVAVLKYALRENTLQVLSWATGTCRLPKSERIELWAPAVAGNQLYTAYCQALEGMPQGWGERLRQVLGGMRDEYRLLNDVLMVYSPDDNQLLVEQQRWGSTELLGATWRGFPFEDILRDGPQLASGEWLPNLARSTSNAGPAAAQLVGLSKQHDVLLAPEGNVVHGIRAIRNAQSQEKRNNPLISWQVLEPRALGKVGLKAIDAPHRQTVFYSFIDTLTDNLTKQGSISRTPLPGKLVKLLVRN